MSDLQTQSTVSRLRIVHYPSQQGPRVSAVSDHFVFLDSVGETNERISQQRRAFSNVLPSETIRTRVPPRDRRADTLSTPIVLRENWRLLQRSELRDDTIGRLFALASKPHGWHGEHAEPLKAESLRTFLEFWLNNKNIAAEPEITMTVRGHLQAEWYRDSRHLLELEFSEGSRVFYGLFDGRSVNEGSDSVGEMEKMLRNRSSKPLTWTIR